jgi:hypothetical protein
MTGTQEAREIRKGYSNVRFSSPLKVNNYMNTLDRKVNKQE